MNHKKRRVFSINNFRGLDKENKLLKASPQRASDGQNFVIDSETLKTRPAIKHYEERFNLFPEDHLDVSNDDIIDWFIYDDETKIFVTTDHIYIYSNYISLNESDSDENFIHSTFGTLDFDGLKPYFQMEKKCLFIFCLNDIYVFSDLIGTDENGRELRKHVLYDLKNKPSNPFDEDNQFYQQFEDLPTPYEPTVLIGDKRFEDVNMLSNSYKYSLFATSGFNQDGTKVTYELPTHYDPDKNLGFSYDIIFYKDKFKDYEILPVFMGVLGENFETLSDSVLSVTPPEIKQTFFPIDEFEFNGNPESKTQISGIVNIDRNTFFNFSIKDTDQRVFEYIMSYIKTHSTELTSNVLFPFKMNIEYTAIYRDASTNYITLKKKERTQIDVYVMLKKYEMLDFALDKTDSFESNIALDYDNTTIYPAHPYTETNYADVLTITKNTSGIPTFTTFEQDGNNLIFNSRDLYNNSDEILVVGNYYEDMETNSTPTIILDSLSDWETGYPQSIPTTSYPEYPYYDYTGIPTSNIIELTPTETPRFSSVYSIVDESSSAHEEFKLLIVNKIMQSINTFQDEFGDGVAKVRAYDYTSTDVPIEERTKRSMVIGFSYDKGNALSYKKKKTYAYTSIISSEQKSITADLSDFTFDENKNMFKLEIKDYFFDYNNEPSIDIKVTFDYNPDFNKIAKNKFGTTFGSENRLFLAGHTDYPNIDRYNVSNDLLGNNQKNQSYELTYFPSKNYRVIGGKSKINGYVTATDSTLYITKEENRNDEQLFIRERMLDENGVVGYKEYKTNINKSPINNKCLARFNNDILMLTKDGLYAVEISKNILTNERLLKLRSGFVNKDLVNTIKNADNDIFILENNDYLYIFIDNVCYVADSRYIDVNKNGDVDNLSYEIVKWTLPLSYKTGHFINDELVLLETDGQQFYYLKEEESFDDEIYKRNNMISQKDITNANHSEQTAFLPSYQLNEFLSNPENLELTFYNINKIVAKENEDYVIEGNELVIKDYTQFATFVDGDFLMFMNETKDYSYEFEFNPVNDRITLPEGIAGDKSVVYKRYYKQPLYIYIIFDYLLTGETEYTKLIKMLPYKPDEVIYVEKQSDETDDEYLARLDTYFVKNSDYIKPYSPFLDCQINVQKPIEMVWVSPITDFGNKLMEKTMFKTNLYATKQAQENVLLFGYKTMRRLKTFQETQGIALSNPFDFDGVNFNVYSVATFNEIGKSLPTKENNFLYIQFMVKGYGNIELNAIEIIYKLNRNLKTIG